MTTPPSMNPANLQDPIATVRLVLNKFLAGVDDMMPAQVISYNRATNVAQVQPLIVVVNTNDIQIERATIAAVPVLQLGGGGFVLSFPINAGDLGWIKANDRDISLFKQFHKKAPPNTQRKHSFEDALFIPDTMMQGITINAEDANRVVLQSLDGNARISISGDQVKITAETIILDASDKITLDTPLTEITGQLIGGTNSSYDRTATFNGDIRTTGDVKGGHGSVNVSLNTHTHDGVQTGSGNTGEPN